MAESEEEEDSAVLAGQLAPGLSAPDPDEDTGWTVNEELKVSYNYGDDILDYGAGRLSIADALLIQNEWYHEFHDSDFSTDDSEAIQDEIYEMLKDAGATLLGAVPSEFSESTSVYLNDAGSYEYKYKVSVRTDSEKVVIKERYRLT